MRVRGFYAAQPGRNPEIILGQQQIDKLIQEEKEGRRAEACFAEPLFNWSSLLIVLGILNLQLCHIQLLHGVMSGLPRHLLMLGVFCRFAIIWRVTLRRDIGIRIDGLTFLLFMVRGGRRTTAKNGTNVLERKDTKEARRKEKQERNTSDEQGGGLRWL